MAEDVLEAVDDIVFMLATSQMLLTPSSLKNKFLQPFQLETFKFVISFATFLSRGRSRTGSGGPRGR